MVRLQLKSQEVFQDFWQTLYLMLLVVGSVVVLAVESVSWLKRFLLEDNGINMITSFMTIYSQDWG